MGFVYIWKLKCFESLINYVHEYNFDAPENGLDANSIAMQILD